MKANKARLIILAISVAVFILSSCQPKRTKLFDPKQVDFSATYNPLFDGQIYPSLILGLNNRLATDAPHPLFSISVTSPTDGAVLRVVVDSSTLNYVTIIQEILPHRGEQYTFTPTLKWKYDILRRLRQPGGVDLTFSCFINDEEVDIKNLHLSYRSINECPLSLSSGGAIEDFRWLFAGYVNEDHPQIQSILTDILDQGIVSRFSGYQNNAKAVEDQVFAVWYYALSRGITYSSISCTSNPSKRANVQHIRFFDEVWSTRQANCVDACVFLASIMRKIGLKPIIFVEPCHAYLGYYTDKSQKKIALLETTITAWVNFPELERSLDENGLLPDEKYAKVKKYLSASEQVKYEEGKIDFSQLKLIVARSLFDKASEYNREQYEKNKEHFASPDAITYQQLDIESLRKVVQPIN